MRSRPLLAVFALAGLWLVPGCHAPPRVSAASQPVASAGNAELMESIGDQAFVARESAYRAAYILKNGEPYEGEGFDALREEMLRQKLAAERFRAEADEAVTRAEVAFVVARAIDLHSGLNWMLSGLGRYALRELEYRGIIDPASEYGYVSGGEFLGILRRADEFMQKQRHSTLEDAELGTDPGSAGSGARP